MDAGPVDSNGAYHKLDLLGWVLVNRWSREDGIKIRRSLRKERWITAEWGSTNTVSVTELTTSLHL